MKEEIIKKSIEINAPKEKVWEVLLRDEYTRIWYAEFSEGTHAETDWKVGSKILFTDNSGSGLVSKVMVNKPFEAITIEHQAAIIQGKEDVDSADAKNWKGCVETYLLSEKDGVTTLSIYNEMPEEYLEPFLLAWDKALPKIKELSESIVN